MLDLIRGWIAGVRGDASELSTKRVARLRQAVGSLADIVAIDKRESPATAAALFHKKFRVTIPDFPRHYIATYVPTGSVLGYVHMTDFGGVQLCGGLCVDEMKYREMRSQDFARVKEAGGIAKLLLIAGVVDGPHALGTFAYTGVRNSRDLIVDIGFRCIQEPYIYGLWHSTSLAAAEKEAAIARVKSVGPF